MQTSRALWRDSLPLLILFCVVAGGLFLFRQEISRAYLATMVPLVNELFHAGGLAIELVRRAHILKLAYPSLGLEFTIHDIIYQNLIVGLALVAATPGPGRWRLKWMGIVLVALWVTHVLSLYLGGYVIIWDFVASLPIADQTRLSPRVLEVIPRDRDWLLSRVFGIWHTWGRPSAAIWIWLFAARDYLGLAGRGDDDDGADAPSFGRMRSAHSADGGSSC